MDVSLLKHTKPCVTKDMFLQAGYIEESENVYSKVDYGFFLNIITGNQEALQRTIRFKILGVDETLGTNIEFYIDTRLQRSGYWTTLKDFNSTFKV